MSFAVLEFDIQGTIMKSKRALSLALGLAFGAALARGDTLTFTCGPNISAATCNSLNTTIAAIYDSTFSNVSANIYIQYGTTGLGSNEGLHESDFVRYLRCRPRRHG